MPAGDPPARTLDGCPLIPAGAPRRQLEQRVETLEDIVCNVEFELDQRLHRLGPGAATAGSLPRRALPAHSLARAGLTAAESAPSPVGGPESLRATSATTAAPLAAAALASHR